MGVFDCAKDVDGVLKLQGDDSITCYSSNHHLALLIPSAIILIYTSIRLNRVDNNDLGATEIRFKNVFDYRGDFVRSYNFLLSMGMMNYYADVE